jgi:hypothetical protein
VLAEARAEKSAQRIDDQSGRRARGDEDEDPIASVLAQASAPRYARVVEGVLKDLIKHPAQVALNLIIAGRVAEADYIEGDQHVLDGQ